jgi:hypothetical protein
LHRTSLGIVRRSRLVDAEQCRCRGPFRDLKIALMLMLPSAAQQFRLETTYAFSITSFRLTLFNLDLQSTSR